MGDWMPWQDTFGMTVKTEPVHVRVSVTGQNANEAKWYRDHLDKCVTACAGLNPEAVAELIDKSKALLVSWDNQVRLTIPEWEFSDALLAVEKPMTDKPNDKETSIDQHYAAKEPEEVPDGPLCDCGCNRFFADYVEQIDHLQEVGRLIRCENQGRAALIRKMEGELRETKAELGWADRNTAAAMRTVSGLERDLHEAQRERDVANANTLATMHRNNELTNELRQAKADLVFADRDCKIAKQRERELSASTQTIATQLQDDIDRLRS